MLMKPTCLKVADTFGKGKRARITTPAGTDLTMDIAGRPGNALYCIVGPGQFSPVPNVEANIAELGGGLNPKCKMIGIMLEDEGVQGSAHIGVGTNITLGGTIKAPCHYDLLVWHPRIEIDGEVVIDGKEVRV